MLGSWFAEFFILKDFFDFEFVRDSSLFSLGDVILLVKESGKRSKFDVFLKSRSWLPELNPKFLALGEF